MLPEAMPARILISACLLGRPVRYDGRGKKLQDGLIETWQRAGLLVPLCPEVAGGLPTPRPPAEITPGAQGADVLSGRARILDITGKDVTDPFLDGAAIAVATARQEGCRFALLMDRSPSCGSTRIYSGHHDGRTRPGSGVVAAALIQAGVEVFAPDRIADLARRLAGTH